MITTAAMSETGKSAAKAHRYFQEAKAIKRPLPISAPSVSITIKIPEDVTAELRAFAQFVA